MSTTTPIVHLNNSATNWAEFEDNVIQRAKQGKVYCMIKAVAPSHMSQCPTKES